MRIKKDGLVIYNSIDNTGSTDDASLGARYTKGRLDSTDNNLHHNYYTKEEVQRLISEMGRTKIVPTLEEDWFIYVPDEETTDKEIYYQVSNNTVVDTPVVEDLPTYYRQWKNEGGEIVPVQWFISCAKDAGIVSEQTYYTLGFSGPGPKSTLMKNYVKARIEIEQNTYYFVGNDTDGYQLYYFDSDFKEAKIGSFEIEFAEFVTKEREIGSHALDEDITAQNIQDDIKDLTAILTNKTIDADDNTIENIDIHNFKDGLVKTAMPETPVDTELLSAKAIDEAKQDTLSKGTAISTVTDDTTISKVDLDNNEVAEATAKAMFEYIAKKIYPVGAIYISVDSTSPGDIFGGTWERINGRFLVGAGNNGASGDEKLNLTAGTTGGVYRHQHQYGIKYGAYYGQPTTTSDSTAIQLKTWNSSNTQSWSTGTQKGNVQGRYSSWSGEGSISSLEHSANTNLVNNLPPYLVVYMWKRTA